MYYCTRSCNAASAKGCFDCHCQDAKMLFVECVRVKAISQVDTLKHMEKRSWVPSPWDARVRIHYNFDYLGYW